jgi:anaerobic selenocysteine-containing dehydrogenase
LVSAPHIWALSLKARRELNGKVVVIDPRRSESASQADLWIRPKPGSDVALTYGIARYLIQNGLADLDFIKAWTHGFEAYESEAMTWTPERVEEATGVDWASVERLGAAYAELTPNAMTIGIGFQKSIQGAEAVRATSLLPALLGQHRGFFYTNAPGYLVDHGYLIGKPFMTRSPQVVSQVALSDYVARGDYKFIYVYGMNPVLTLPNQKAFREGLCREDVFVVVHETHWTETCGFADVVLPAQTYLEKEDIVIPWSHWYTRKSQKAVAPLGESMHEVDVMVEISKRLGLREAWLYEDPWKAIEKSLEDALETGSFNDLVEGRTVKLKYRDRNEYQTPSGKIEFSSRLAEEKGYPGLPNQISPKLEEGEYLLLNSSDRKYTHTQFQEVYGPIPAVVKMNPDDARQLGARDDEVVTLFNDLGRTAVRVKVSDSVPVGVLWSPKQFPGLEGEPQNILTRSRPQQIGGGSVYNSTTVRLQIGKQMQAKVP